MGYNVEMTSIVPKPPNHNSIEAVERNDASSLRNVASVALDVLPVASSSSSCSTANAASATVANAPSVKIDVKGKAETSQEPRYQPWHLKLNAAVVCGLMALQSVLNRSLGEDSIGAKASNIGASLLVNCVTSSGIAKILKANWREQGSTAGQIGCLGAFSLFAFTTDVVTCLAFGRGKSALFGETTLLQLMTSLGLIAKMGAAALLGKHTFALGEKSPAPDPKTKNLRLAGTMGLIVGLSTVNTLINHLYAAGSVTSVLCNLAFSSAFGKVVKTQMKNEKPKISAMKSKS